MFGALVLADPLVANGLVELGYKTKEDLADWLQKNTLVSVKDVESMLYSMLPRGPQAANLTDDMMIPKWPRADSFNFVAVGGQTNPYHQLANHHAGKSLLGMRSNVIVLKCSSSEDT